MKWRQSWSSCEEEENKEGEGDSKREGKKMYLEKLKKKSVNVFRSIEDEMTSNSGRAEESYRVSQKKLPLRICVFYYLLDFSSPFLHTEFVFNSK